MPLLNFHFSGTPTTCHLTSPIPGVQAQHTQLQAYLQLQAQLQALEPLSVTLAAEELAVSITMAAKSVLLKLILIMDLVGLEVLTTTMVALITTLEVAELAVQTILVAQSTTGLTLVVCLVAKNVRPNGGLMKLTMETTMAPCMAARSVRLKLAYCGLCGVNIEC